MQLEGQTGSQGGFGCVLVLRGEQRSSATAQAQTLVRSSGVGSAGLQTVADCPGKVQGTG